MSNAEEVMSVTRLSSHFRFPGGHRVAVLFNIACEAWSDGKAPGIGPMGNLLQPGYFDTNAHSRSAKDRCDRGIA